MPLEQGTDYQTWKNVDWRPFRKLEMTYHNAIPKIGEHIELNIVSITYQKQIKTFE